MNHKSGCVICGEELVYKDKDELLSCHYCGGIFNSNAHCINGHYICDQCHSLSANDIIQDYCITSKSTSPLNIAMELMKRPTIKMHGPEHHFLVPAVLLAAYYNSSGNVEEKESKIIKARERAEKVLGGFCGTHGSCGAGLGTGIFISLITNATPLSKEGWKDANRMTAKSLASIAEHGGPRCCKRTSFLAIKEATGYLDMGQFDQDDEIQCEFSNLNKECLKKECPFFRNVI